MIDTYLDGLLKTEGVLFAEANSGPFEHLGLLGEVRDGEGLVLGEKSLIVGTDQVVDLVEEVLAALDPLLSF